MSFDMTAEPDDEALLVLFANGDRDAARELTLRLAPPVLAMVTRLVGDRAEAEDITQEAMLRLWKIAPEWKSGQAKPSTWLYRVARNLGLDRLRRRRGGSLDDVDEPADEQPAIDQQLIDRDRAQALNAALAALPERQRTAVGLRHLDGLSNPQIAEIMEISVEAVESLTARGKRSLAALLLPQRDKLGLER